MFQRTESLGQRTRTLQKGARHLFRALLRADIYRILAIGFDEPNAERLGELRELIAELHPLDPILDSLYELSVMSPDLPAEYNDLFCTKVLCPPYEGSYLLTERGAVLGDVSAFYKAFELKFLTREGPPDSIKMELAFLSYMALKEAYALENKLLSEAQTTFEAQAKFIRDHLGRWGGSFASRLKQTTTFPYYKTLAEFLEMWLAEENRHFKILPVELPTLLPKSVDDEVGCNL